MQASLAQVMDATADKTNLTNQTNALKKVNVKDEMKKQVHFYEPDSNFINEAKGAKFGKLRIVVNENNEL